MVNERISTGIPGLDEVFHGGFQKHFSYLLVGSAGTGKTIFSLQWLLNGQRLGEKGVFITLAEPIHKIEQNIAGFGWSVQGIEVVDLSSKGIDDRAELNEYHV